MQPLFYILCAISGFLIGGQIGSAVGVLIACVSDVVLICLEGDD